ncbi:ribosome-binding factor A [Tamilnaduibacter salinus]|uniref:Ribosome-binding factor A n=1 Tax=Tamilnaduibacter salinus TaxID=1484056 RepID=A0A2A2I506_9GAMM|nr:30S ribosome-binding factor RbfA [Tamilnaduibacter salinus]PAV26819.1 ribosome-binding factor A [Tamilnaduibacter salinus]PVY75941.1 ribosome-binding factor A [Tamilnaduibacter salinus]
MPKEFSRTERVGDQIQRELAQLIQREVKDPRLGMVTINAVRVSRDLGYADVYISLLTTDDLSEDHPDIADALMVLRKAGGFLRGQIGRAMKLRVVPELRFHFDNAMSQSRRLDDLIDQAVGKEPVVRHTPDDDGDGESRE